jgi:SAM-dependent MidA family methyltransferase
MNGGEARGRRRPGEIRGSSFEVGLRRVPELDPTPLPDSDPGLVARIADEIRSTGPMTFARFMQLALYDPEAGYYTTGSAGPGREGDFLTAPEGHPIFGWAVARHLESAWDAIGRPAEFVIREHGAGSGALAAGILDGLRRSGSPLLHAVRYQPIDVSTARLAALRARLSALALDASLAVPDDRPASGAILANELLDALPVHRVEGGPDGELLEVFVTLRSTSPDSRAGIQPDAAAQADAGAGPHGSAFSTVLGRPSTPALADRLASEGITLQPGQPAELCLVLDDWIARAAAPLERGVMLLIDYGAPASELYRPERGGTLRAYHRHRVHDDPLVAIGRQDLTAHVDLTAVERAAAAAGLQRLGRSKQADFLAALGIGELLVDLQSDPSTTIESYLAARSAVVRMLDPRATGGFAVLAFGRGLPDGSRLRGLG